MTDAQLQLLLASQKDILDLLSVGVWCLKALVFLNIATLLIWAYNAVSGDQTPED